MRTLIRKLRSRLEQMSAKIGDEVLVVQHYQTGLARTITLHIYYHLSDQVTSLFRYTSIKKDDFNNFMASVKGRQLGK